MKNIILPFLLVLTFVILIADPKPITKNERHVLKEAHQGAVGQIIKETNDYYQKHGVQSKGKIKALIQEYKGHSW